MAVWPLMESTAKGLMKKGRGVIEVKRVIHTRQACGGKADWRIDATGAGRCAI